MIMELEFIRSFKFPTKDFEDDLMMVSGIMNRSVSDASFRAQLHQVWDVLEVLIQTPPQDTNNLRIFRGFLLIIRNMVTEPHDLDLGPILTTLVNFRQFEEKLGEMYGKILVVYYQIIANFTNIQKPHCMTQFSQIVIRDAETTVPLLISLKNILENSQNVYDLLTSSYGQEVMQFLLGFEVTDSPTETETLYIQAWERIVVHETFSKWIVDNQSIQVFKIVQIVITSRDDWNNHDLIGILSWIFKQYKSFGDSTLKAFDNNDIEALSTIHPRLLIILDCISELCKFIIAKDFLINYKLVETLVPLLGTVHKNVEPRNMTKKPISNEVEFPHIKSIIIEIISYLVYDNFEVQEAIRESHGLEVILSNCIIDDNNPYIKERAIICLKYLLHKNAENQKFVADLEAKQQVSGDLLDQIGSEIDIKDGNLRVKEGVSYI